MNDTQLEELKQFITGTVSDVVSQSEVRTKVELAEMRLEMREGFMNVGLEFADVRQEMREGFTAVRQEMSEELAVIRLEMSDEFVAVRREMSDGFAAVRLEMSDGFTDIRKEVHAGFMAASEATAYLIDITDKHEKRLPKLKPRSA